MLTARRQWPQWARVTLLALVRGKFDTLTPLRRLGRSKHGPLHGNIKGKKCKWQYAQYVHGKASRTSIHNRYNAQGSAGKHCRDRISTLTPQFLQRYEKGNPKMLQVRLILHWEKWETRVR